MACFLWLSPKVGLWTEESKLLFWIAMTRCLDGHNFSIGINGLDFDEATKVALDSASHTFHHHWLWKFRKIDKIFLVW